MAKESAENRVVRLDHMAGRSQARIGTGELGEGCGVDLDAADSLRGQEVLPLAGGPAGEQGGESDGQFVGVPGPGRLLLTGRGVKRVAKGVKRAGNVTVRVNATGKARKRLRSRGRVTLRLKLRFTPAGGLPGTRGRTVELVLKRR